jgi:hypothetical protein
MPIVLRHFKSTETKIKETFKTGGSGLVRVLKSFVDL